MVIVQELRVVGNVYSSLKESHDHPFAHHITYAFPLTSQAQRAYLAFTILAFDDQVFHTTSYASDVASLTGQVVSQPNT